MESRLLLVGGFLAWVACSASLPADEAERWLAVRASGRPRGGLGLFMPARCFAESLVLPAFPVHAPCHVAALVGCWSSPRRVAICPASTAADQSSSVLANLHTSLEVRAQVAQCRAGRLASVDSVKEPLS